MLTKNIKSIIVYVVCKLQAELNTIVLFSKCLFIISFVIYQDTALFPEKEVMWLIEMTQ